MISLETDIKTAIERRNNQLVVKRVQDVEPYLEANKRERNAYSDWAFSRRREGMRKVAEIPNIVVEQWMKEGINVFDRNHAKAVQAKLNSNEYAYLRTSPGRCKVT